MDVEIFHLNKEWICYEDKENVDWPFVFSYHLFGRINKKKRNVTSNVIF